MKPKTITRLFIAAGLANIVGVLVCSKLLTNEVLMQAQPDVMNRFGLVGILLWGMSYIAVSKRYASVPWLVVVFVLEKLIYVIAYGYWISNHSLAAVFEQDLLAGVFYSVYGLNDLLSMLFFIWVFKKVYAS